MSLSAGVSSTAPVSSLGSFASLPKFQISFFRLNRRMDGWFSDTQMVLAIWNTLCLGELTCYLNYCFIIKCICGLIVLSCLKHQFANLRIPLNPLLAHHLCFKGS